MKTPTLHTLSLTVAMLGATLSGALAADGRDGFPYADELDSCVSAVYEHIDVARADRVRHTVVHRKRTGIGYALNIETSVFAGDRERRFSTYCVASGSRAPTKFTIAER